MDLAAEKANLKMAEEQQATRGGSQRLRTWVDKQLAAELGATKAGHFLRFQLGGTMSYRFTTLWRGTSSKFTIFLVVFTTLERGKYC